MCVHWPVFMYMYFSMYMCKRPCNARPAALFVCFPSQGKEYRFRLMEIKGDISQRVDVRDPQGPQIRGMLGDAGPKEQYNYGSSPHRSGTNSPTTMVIYVIFTIIHSYNFQMMYLLVTGTAAPKWRFNQAQKVINARGLIGRVTFWTGSIPMNKCGWVKMIGPNLGSSWNEGTPIAGWFIMDNPTKMDDLGVLPFQETSICFNCWIGKGQKRIIGTYMLRIFAGHSLYLYGFVWRVAPNPMFWRP